MNIEIERKFLINHIPNGIENSIHIIQYYLHIDENFVQRLRLFNHEKSILSIKQNCEGMSRHEFEYEIPFDDAKKIISMGSYKYVEKNRHIISIGSHLWEIDEFLGKNKGLVIAEIELQSENDDISFPKWIDKEVTNQNKYYNYNLATKPYISW